MIETHDLSREYGPKLALSRLNLRVDPGEILGFLGPNGAGKSTTAAPRRAMILLYLGARFGSYLDLAGGRTSAACAAEKRTRGESWFTTGEARAVALLVRSQFRDDHRFRMGVLGLLPFTLLYMVMGVRNGAIADPFARRAATLFARRGSSSPARAPA